MLMLPVTARVLQLANNTTRIFRVVSPLEEVQRQDDTEVLAAYRDAEHKYRYLM